MKPYTYKDKKVLVMGLARSGAGAAKLLSALGADVTVSDTKSRSLLEPVIRQLPPSVHVITGDNPQDAIDVSELIVLSPGIPADISPLNSARDKGTEIISEIELAYRVMREVSDVPFIGITGTNGKSTVTSLVDLMLKKSGYDTLLGGNIGNALTEEIRKRGLYGSQGLLKAAPDYVVAEISSFQLESIREFRPRISSILNISPDHLDRYDSVEDYIHAKAEIFSHQTPEDYLIVNADDPILMKLIRDKLKVRSEQPKTLYFSSRGVVEGMYIKEGVVYSNCSHFSVPASHLPLISVSEIGIKGLHNMENAMASSLIALLAGAGPDDITDVLRSFKGLEHRLEFVKEEDGITYINDSKGTNVGAVAKSLESFEQLILIMGGTDKGSDFSILKDLVKERVKLLILIGEAGEKIAQSLGQAVKTYKAGNLGEAVEHARKTASSGDTVLLSPGCASFDMFDNFEERGREFKRIVHEVTG